MEMSTYTTMINAAVIEMKKNLTRGGPSGVFMPILNRHPRLTAEGRRVIRDLQRARLGFLQGPAWVASIYGLQGTYLWVYSVSGREVLRRDRFDVVSLEGHEVLALLAERFGSIKHILPNASYDALEMVPVRHRGGRQLLLRVLALSPPWIHDACGYRPIFGLIDASLEGRKRAVEALAAEIYSGNYLISREYRC